MLARAVVFDLFALLPFSRREYRGVVAEMARVLTAPPFDFVRLWDQVMDARESAAAGTLDDDLHYCLRTLGVFTHLEQRLAAVSLFYEFHQRLLAPAEETVDALKDVRAHGLAVGLIANCVPLVARLWPESALAPLVDAAVFSCEAGCRTPDARIYALAAARLGVEPSACLYASNVSEALLGAQAAGMRAVLVSTAGVGFTADDPTKSGPWTGERVQALAEVCAAAGGLD